MYPQSYGDVSPTIRLLSLSEDVLVEADPGGDLLVLTRWGEFEFPNAHRELGESLRRMSLGPVALDNLMSLSYERPEQRSGSHLERMLDLLSGSVVHSLGLPDGQTPLLSVSPTVQTASFLPRPVEPSRLLRLSRFAVLRPDNGEFVLESPCAPFSPRLQQPIVGRVAMHLAGAATFPEVASATGVDEETVRDVISYLVASGVVVPADEHGEFEEDNDRALRQWTSHELTFHVRSRSRQADGPSEQVVGDAADVTPPVTKPVPAGRRFPLYRPEPAERSGDVPLIDLLETDHTCPELSGRAVPAERLGELLFRSARIRSIGPAHLNSGVSHEASQRPYFNTACLYELELYLALDRCTGLPGGIYHYDPLEHTLTLVNDSAQDRGELLETAMTAAAGTRRPAALLTVSVRLQRTSWALGAASYAAALMHFGALQETLYLVAKAMGLSVHAVPVDAGNGVNKALGLDWPAEVGIGECVIDILP